MATCIPVEMRGVKASKRALVDDEDAAMVRYFKWREGVRGAPVAASGSRAGGDILMYRLIMGEPPEGYEIDHINGDNKDNRKSNLRFCTHAQNSKNRKLNKNNKYGAKGISFDGRGNLTKPWRVYINQHVYVGSFETLEEARNAREKAEQKLQGEFARAKEHL
jgi:hypothetical protein